MEETKIFYSKGNVFVNTHSENEHTQHTEQNGVFNTDNNNINEQLDTLNRLLQIAKSWVNTSDKPLTIYDIICRNRYEYALLKEYRATTSTAMEMATKNTIDELIKNKDKYFENRNKGKKKRWFHKS